MTDLLDNELPIHNNTPQNQDWFCAVCGVKPACKCEKPKPSPEKCCIACEESQHFENCPCHKPKDEVECTHNYGSMGVGCMMGCNHNQVEDHIKRLKSYIARNESDKWNVDGLLRELVELARKQ